MDLPLSSCNVAGAVPGAASYPQRSRVEIRANMFVGTDDDPFVENPHVPYSQLWYADELAVDTV